MQIFLNSSSQSSPVVGLNSNKSLAGSIVVQFFDSSDADLVLYNTQPSAWQLIAYLNIQSPPKSNAVSSIYPVQIKAPQGLAMAETLQQQPFNSKSFNGFSSSPSLSSTMYVASVQVTNIGCSQVNEYYDGFASASSSYRCYICLQNSSCNMCGDNSCGLAGTCSSSDTVYTPSTGCCAGGCMNGGTCQASDQYNSFSCQCTIYYVGKNCESLGVLPFSLIAVGAFLIFVLIIGKILYDKYAKQKFQVLNEIRNHILNSSDSAAISSSKNSEYIQHMQQALILNDVFVNYDEIKFEKIIGEGSFGVVYKASFRGAQVAVKKMRSMFIQMSEKDTEEFKKEAYVMSRSLLTSLTASLFVSLFLPV